MALNTDPANAPIQTVRVARLLNNRWCEANGKASFFGTRDVVDGTVRIARKLYVAPHGAYMITSEPIAWHVRAYTLWFCRETGEITRLSDPHEYRTRGRAHRTAERMAAADWATRHRIVALGVRVAPAERPAAAAISPAETALVDALRALDARISPSHIPQMDGPITGNPEVEMRARGWSLPRNGQPGRILPPREQPEGDGLPSAHRVALHSNRAVREAEMQDRMQRGETRDGDDPEYAEWMRSTREYIGDYDPDVNPPIRTGGDIFCHSGEGAIYSLPYLKSKYGRDTA